MIGGTADFQAQAASAPTVLDLQAAPWVISDADLFKANFEIGWEGHQALLPPALIPTNPPYVSILFLRATASTLGPFTLAQLQVGCRAGSAARGYVLRTFVDNAAVGGILAERWGVASSSAVIRVHRQYDAVRASVIVGDRAILELVGRDAVVLAPSDISYNPLMTLANTLVGVRLLNVELQVEVHQAERLELELPAFDAEAWGDSRVRLTHPIAATAVLGNVTFPQLRFVCDPAVSALDGTEDVTSLGVQALST